MFLLGDSACAACLTFQISYFLMSHLSSPGSSHSQNPATQTYRDLLLISIIYQFTIIIARRSYKTKHLHFQLALVTLLAAVVAPRSSIYMRRSDPGLAANIEVSLRQNKAINFGTDQEH